MATGGADRRRIRVCVLSAPIADDEVVVVELLVEASLLFTVLILLRLVLVVDSPLAIFRTVGCFVVGFFSW